MNKESYPFPFSDEALAGVEPATCLQRFTRKLCNGCSFCDPHRTMRTERNRVDPSPLEKHVSAEAEASSGW